MHCGVTSTKRANRCTKTVVLEEHALDTKVIDMTRLVYPKQTWIHIQCKYCLQLPRGSVLPFGSRPLVMPPLKRSTIKCFGCHRHLARSEFKAVQLRHQKPRCLTCVAATPLGRPPAPLLCSRCGDRFLAGTYSTTQLHKGSSRKCPTCVAGAPARSGASRAEPLGLCSLCGVVLPWDSFPPGKMPSPRPTSPKLECSLPTS